MHQIYNDEATANELRLRQNGYGWLGRKGDHTTQSQAMYVQAHTVAIYAWQELVYTRMQNVCKQTFTIGGNILVIILPYITGNITTW